jgi:hypothetical protein
MKWIKFSEKQPEKGKQVLVLSDYGTMWVDCLMDGVDDYFWYDKSARLRGGKVIYWAKLPEITDKVKANFVETGGECPRH